MTNKGVNVVASYSGGGKQVVNPLSCWNCGEYAEILGEHMSRAILMSCDTCGIVWNVDKFQTTYQGSPSYSDGRPLFYARRVYSMRAPAILIAKDGRAYIGNDAAQ